MANRSRQRPREAAASRENSSGREFIAERTDETIDRDDGFADPEVAKAWTDEIARRIEMLDKGLAKPLQADIALRQAREHLERRRDVRGAGPCEIPQ